MLEVAVHRAYGEARKGETVAAIGSHDFLEISVNQRNAAKKYNVKSGDKLSLHRL